MNVITQRRAQLAGAFATAMLMAACGTGRLGDDTAPVDRLTPGVTTVADATALLGPHMSGKGFSNGQRLLQWGTAATTPSTLALRRVAILFGEGWRMLSVIHTATRQEAR